MLRPEPPSQGSEEAGAALVHLTRRITDGAAGGLGRSSVLAAVVAALLLVLAALPAAAGNGPSDLGSPAVSPETGTTATPITFSVTYRSSKGQAPDYVQVVVGSKTFRMAKTAGYEEWKNGVRYRVTKKLPAG